MERQAPEKLAGELQAQGHRVSPSGVSKLLKQLGFSLQANRKTREGADHPDRDAQFEYINTQTTAAPAADEPAIWWPKLRREYDDPSDGQRATWTADQRRASMIHHPVSTPGPQ